VLDPTQLTTLRAVVDAGSFAAAATQLQYTPSAVSQQMAALERACGVPLFERLPHQVRPTAAAQRLAELAGGPLADLAAAEREIAGMARGEEGRLRVGAFPTAGATILPRALAALRRLTPGAEVELVEGEPELLVPQVQDGRLDLALVYEYDLVSADFGTLVRVALRHEPLRVLLPASRRDVSVSVRLADLRDETFVAALEGSAGAVNLDRMCAAARFRPRVSFRSNDYAVMRGLVGAALGVAVVPELGVAPDRAVRAVPLAGRPLRRRVDVVHRPTAANPLLAPMLAALRGF
jgi:DNA-binding transcriptional LysR family regulator